MRVESFGLRFLAERVQDLGFRPGFRPLSLFGFKSMYKATQLGGGGWRHRFVGYVGRVRHRVAGAHPKSSTLNPAPKTLSPKPEP